MGRDGRRVKNAFKLLSQGREKHPTQNKIKEGQMDWSHPVVERLSETGY
jgi:hypothetical protein